MKIVSFLLIIVIAQCLCHNYNHARYQVINILKLKDNFYKAFSKTIQKVVNGVFDSLGVSEEFVEEPKIKTLLIMHNDLHAISEKNFDLYDVLRNVSAVAEEDQPINRIRLNERLRQILNENEFDVYNNTKVGNSKKVKSTDTATAESFSSEFADSKEFKAFIGGFIGKLKKLTVEDLFPIKFKVNKTEREQSNRRNLQIWEPPPREETELYNLSNRRIYGGKTTNIMAYPFVVSIHVRGEFVCAGSIISSNLVITAASCLLLKHNAYIRFKSDYTSRNGEQVPVLETFLYPQYDPKTLHHNIAILRLQRSLESSRILIDRGNFNIPPHSRVTILGWGAKEPNQAANHYQKLNYGVLSAYHIDECKEIYSETYVTDNHFCAGLKSGGSGACNKDIGGPGIIDNLLTGVVSFGSPVCGDPDSPTVFTRVGFYTEWIDDIMSLRTSKQDMETNIKKGDKILIYYNKPFSQMVPRMHLSSKYHIRSPLSSALRTNNFDVQEDPDESDMLNK